MAKRPVFRVSLFTKSGFNQFPEKYIDVCAVWEGDRGLWSMFSDGSFIGGSGYGYRIDAILFEGGITAEPSNVWLNARMTDNGLALLVRSKSTREEVDFITQMEGDEDWQGRFAEGVTGVRFTAISDSGNQETFTVTPENVFVNVNTVKAVAATDTVTQTISADDVPF